MSYLKLCEGLLFVWLASKKYSWFILIDCYCILLQFWFWWPVTCDHWAKWAALENCSAVAGCCIGVKIMVQIFSEAKLFNLDFALSWNTSYEELPLIINWSIKVHLSITRYFNFQFGDSSCGRFRSRRCECGQCDQPRHQHPSSSSSSEILELSLVIVTFQLSKIIFTVLTNKKCFQTVGK